MTTQTIPLPPFVAVVKSLQDLFLRRAAEEAEAEQSERSERERAEVD